MRTISMGVDTQDRAQVQDFFNIFYYASEAISPEWSGCVDDCRAGTNSLAYAEATILRVNWFRAMAGLPADILLDTTLNNGCQEAALMMSAERRVSHDPGTDWACYSAEGASAAGRSNVILGRAGPDAIDSYMDDQGSANYYVGHRRWILYPRQQSMGTGSVPAATDWLAANALYVLAAFGPRPSEPEWVAWPPSGFVPYQVLPSRSSRWSFSYHGADFSSASVAMHSEGVNIPVVLEDQVNNQGVGDSTFVWRPEGISSGAPEADVVYHVVVSNVLVGAESRTFEYSVTVFDPEAPLIVSTAWLAPGMVDEGYSAILSALGGREPHLWSLAPDSSPLPSGMYLTGSGALRGTPREVGDFDLIVSVGDAAGATADQLLRLRIIGKPITILYSTPGPTVSVRWDDGGVLQRTANTTDGTWTDVPGATSPHVAETTHPFEAFRLRQP